MKLCLAKYSIVATLAAFLIVPVEGHAEKFDFFVVPTLDQQLDSWYKVPSNFEPTIYIPERIYPDQPFELRLLFRGYALSALGNVNISYDFQFFAPDGSPTPDRGEDFIAYNGPIRNKKSIIINQQYPGVIFDKSYPPGDYEVKIIARDRYAEKTVSRSATVEFSKFEKIANFANEDFYKFWIKNYFRQPDSGKAVFGILQFIDDDPQWIKNNTRLLSFSRHLINENRWLWNHLVNDYHNKPEQRKQILGLMALADNPPFDLLSRLTPDDKAYIDKLRARTLADAGMSAAERTPQRIDALWGQFYATGHLAPFEKIVRSLEYFKLAEAPNEEEMTRTPEETVFWGLVEHLVDVSLLTKYTVYLLDHSDVSPTAKSLLRLALKTADKLLKEKEKAPPDKKNPLSQSR
ncbi:MAG: hypothetical protein C0623_07430 [Desulfuromonas sp.]|nr:MAG: hypothetical protein C0623_07430 [Desulfuromonas sp.]